MDAELVSARCNNHIFGLRDSIHHNSFTPRISISKLLLLFSYCPKSRREGACYFCAGPRHFLLQ